ncbi:MAG: XRE family transcriptional regulator [Firmicutes bacterium]|nr:XRE family transcriptional regulator [Bacillota bacterium]
MYQDYTKPDKGVLAERIKVARKKAGLTQGQMASRIGVTQPYISKLEKGEHFPEDKTLDKISSALSISKEVLLQPETGDERRNGSNGADKGENAEQKNFENKKIFEMLRNIEGLIKEKYVPERIVPIQDIDSGEKSTVQEVELPVGAGEAFTTDSIVAEHVLPRSITYGATHMLRVRGRSMEPFVMDGDILLVVPQHTIEYEGQMAVVNVGNQTNSVKFVYMEEKQAGLGRNREEATWHPIEEVKVQGIVVGRISTLNVIRECEDRAKLD